MLLAGGVAAAGFGGAGTGVAALFGVGAVAVITGFVCKVSLGGGGALSTSASSLEGAGC